MPESGKAAKEAREQTTAGAARHEGGMLSGLRPRPSRKATRKIEGTKTRAIAEKRLTMVQKKL